MNSLCIYQGPQIRKSTSLCERGGEGASLRWSSLVTPAAWEMNPTSFTRGRLGRNLYRVPACSSGAERLARSLVWRLETSEAGTNNPSRMECSEPRLCSVTVCGAAASPGDLSTRLAHPEAPERTVLNCCVMLLTTYWIHLSFWRSSFEEQNIYTGLLFKQIT